MPDDTHTCVSEDPQDQDTRQPAPYIDCIIEPQFKDSVFHDPNFFEHFLPFVPSPHSVAGLCLRYDWHLRSSYRWNYPDVIDGEQCLHQPILHILNTVKSATDIVRRSIPDQHIHTVPDLSEDPSTYKDYHVPLKPGLEDLEFTHESVEYFSDWSSHKLPHTLPENMMLHLRPDIILFRGKWRHWSNIRFIVEIMDHQRYLAAGMKRLARYAYAVFAHQPSRRHFYSLLVCGKVASFVRFDRAGLLYSRPLDVVRNPAFAIALASLLSLDVIDEGMNPAFKYQTDGNYIDLFECMLGKAGCVVPGGDSSVHNVGVPTKTKRFRIVQQLGTPANRHINGSGAFVFHIREHFLQEHEEDEQRGHFKRMKADLVADNRVIQSPAEYILKLSWRLDNGRSEGQAFEEAEGTFGVSQHVSHGDIVMSGKCGCLLPSGVPVVQCKLCVDRTPILDGLQVFENFQDLSVNVPLESDCGVSLECVDLGEMRSVPKSTRINRIYSYFLSSSFGENIEQAKSPRVFVTGVMHAILGYWGLYNLGIIHREITPSNLLVLSKKQAFTQKRWEEPRREIKDPVLIASEEELCDTLKRLGNESPIGILIDLASHERLESIISGHIPENHLRGVKKRKGNSGYTVITSVVDGRKYRTRYKLNTGDGPQPPFSYLSPNNGRFSSVRIMRAVLTPKQPYRHHFYDDVESFFWVILWIAIAHVDPGNTLNQHAQNFACDFYVPDAQCSHLSLREDMLEDCLMNGGRVTMARLSACGNEWASDHLLQNVIVSFGGYVRCIRKAEREHGLLDPPGEVFGNVVMTLKAELKAHMRYLQKSQDQA